MQVESTFVVVIVVVVGIVCGMRMSSDKEMVAKVSELSVVGDGADDDGGHGRPLLPILARIYPSSPRFRSRSVYLYYFNSMFSLLNLSMLAI